MTRTFLVVSWAVLTSLTSTAAVQSDAAEQVFESVYGDQYKRVLATPSTDDDVQLAATLLAAAKAATQQPQLLALLCDRAYALGSKDTSGLETAVAAMQLLAANVPARAADCQERVIAARQRQFQRARGDERSRVGQALLAALLAAGDARAEAQDYVAALSDYRRALSLAGSVSSDQRAAIQQLIDRLVTDQRIARDAAQMKTRLEASPDDTATAQRLVKLYVVDMDNPAGAKLYATLSGDDQMKRLVPLAAGDIAGLNEDDCFQLAQWYRALGGDAVGSGKASVLTRAHDYYQHYLQLHTTADLARTKATLALKDVDATLAKLDAPLVARAGAPGSRRRGTPLFNGKDLAGWTVTDGDPNEWRVDRGQLVVAAGRRSNGWLMTEKSYTDFVLQLEFAVNSGGDSGVAIRAEPGRSQIQVQVADESGNSAANNAADDRRTGALYGVAADRRARLKPVGQWNTMTLQVKGTRLRVAVNGEQTLDYDMAKMAQASNNNNNNNGRGRFGRFFGNRFGRGGTPTLNATGRIALQANTGEVHFRNIMIQDMSDTAAK